MSIKKSIKSIICILLIGSMMISCSANNIVDTNNDNNNLITNTNELDTANEPVSDTDRISVQVGHEPDTFDPAENSLLDGMAILGHLFEGLLKYDQNGNLVCGIAESYKVSSDGLTWSFKLKDNLKWSDGSELDADDLVYTWKRVADPTTASSYAYDLLKQVVGYDDASKGELDALSVVARDKKTFVVNLESPCAYFDKICAFCVLSPVKKEVVSRNGDWTEQPSSFISNGPFCVSKFTRDSIIVKKNEYYYDEKNVKLKEIEFVFQDNPEKTYDMYKNDKLLLIKDIPTYNMKDVIHNDDFHIDNMMGTYYISFNTRKEPFDNVKVRKALSLAINRNYISENIMQGRGKAATNFVGPGLTDVDGKSFEDQTKEMYEKPFFDNDYFDLNFEEAKKALNEAGYKDMTRFPELTYILNDEGYNKAIAEYIKQSWAKLGINVKLEYYSKAAFSKKRKTGEFDIVKSGWMCDWDDPSNILSVFETFSGHNYGKYSSNKFDQLVKEARESNVLEDHYMKLHMAERVFLEDYAVIPIYYYETYWMQKDYLKNVRYSPYGILFFINAYIDKSN